MNKLFDIFQNEKTRNPDMTVFYKDNNGLKYLSYKNDEGVLTVRFGENGKEDFYFKNADEKGLGEKVLHLEPKGKGQKGMFGLIEDKMWEIPDRFADLTTEWRFNRDLIKVDDKPKGKNNYERD